jgi:peptide/nickel transport system permease protein
LIFFWTPGADPAARIAGRNASPQVLAAVRHDFGFDRPLYVQYGLMMKKLLITFDLTSFQNRGQRVIPQLVDATPVTLSLVIGGAVLWVIGGIARFNNDEPHVECSTPDEARLLAGIHLTLSVLFL